jgi:hypothetical protein
MKKINLFLITIIVCIYSSCKKDNPNVGLSPKIQKIVPQVILDEIKSKGMKINEGSVPPLIEGIYFVSPFELISPYGVRDRSKKGDIFDNYIYRFSGQSSDKQTVIVDYKNPSSSDIASGLGSFVAGNGNYFTIFAEVKGTVSFVDYTSLIIISGEIAEKGIKNLQQSLYITQKNEAPEEGILIPLNTGRILFDNDFISEKRSSYRLGVEESSKSKQFSASMNSAKEN